MNKILIGERYLEELCEPLKIAGFTPIAIPENPYIDKRLASHADLSIIKANEKTFVLANHLRGEDCFVNFLTGDGNVIFAKKSQEKSYPNDVNLCACRVGKRLIHNLKYTDPSITCNSNDVFINVNQGYSKCMVCKVDENSIITSDCGIAAAAGEAGIEVLLIEPGHISLEGFDTGFIGGASFDFADTVYFTGSLDFHPNGGQIIEFICSRSKKCCFLSEMPVFDIGGAIII